MGWKNIRNFVRDESGVAFVYVGLTTFMVAGFAGMAIDMGHWYSTQRLAQAAADSAAVAGAYEAMWGGDAAAIQAAAETQAERNGFAASTVTTNYPYSHANGAVTTNAVEVIVRQPTQGFFSQVLTNDLSLDVAARSVSGQVDGSPVCVGALDESSSHTLELGGNTVLDATGCHVQVNSSNAKAVTLGGGASVTGESVGITGGVEGSDAGISPSPDYGVPVIADPLFYLTPPTYDPSACEASNSFTPADSPVSPGVYCGGLTLKGGGTITLNPGIYVVLDGKLKLEGGTAIQGDGVGFFLNGANALVDVSSDSAMDLSAPVTGEMAGLIFYQGPDAPAGAVNKFSGGSSGIYEGTLYFPDQKVEMAGSSTAVLPAPHTAIIAQSLKLSGTASFAFNADYASSSVPAMPALGGQSIAILE